MDSLLLKIFFFLFLVANVVCLQKMSSKRHHMPEAAKSGHFHKAAVAADAKECSQVGKRILRKGGHAVDGAIAALLCLGVVNHHSSGVGGGGFMTVYDRKKKESIVYDYREVAPSNIHEHIYDLNKIKAKTGGLAVGVPGEIKGFMKAHKKYGRIAWHRLFNNAIELAESGTVIGKHMAENFKPKVNYDIINDPGLKELLVEDGEMLKEGDYVVNEKYADTLRKLQDNPDDFYQGEIANSIIDDIRNNGGNMTAQDLKSYKARVRKTIKVPFINGLTLHTTPLPGGGSLLAHMMNMVKGYKFSPKNLKSTDDKVLTYHRLVEIMKFSYAMRPHLGDPEKVKPQEKEEFNKFRDAILTQALADEHRHMINDSTTQKDGYYDPFFTTTVEEGTTHVSVLDEEGNAVSATNTINFAWGAKIRSTKTGIVYNNQMYDFFTDHTYGDEFPHPTINAPLAGRRPLSSTCPSILTDKHGNVKMIVGASGGTKSTMATWWVIIKKLIFGYSLSEAVVDARPQHTFYPQYIRNEPTFSLAGEIMAGLLKKKHIIQNANTHAVVQAIYVSDDGKISAMSDPRKEGIAAGY